MVTLFTVLFLISFLVLILGFIHPKLITRFTPIDLSLMKLRLILGGVTLLFFILVGVAAPPAKIASDQNRKEEQPISTNSAIPQDSPIPSSSKTPSVIPTSKPIQLGGTVRVTKVIDGDTIDVEINGKVETLRLIGIDTPETVDPRKPVQCFGVEASNRAKGVLSGQNVRLEADSTQGERDKYNRLLRYVFLIDGTNFNKMMISDGYAHEYTYQSNPYKYQAEFKQAEKEARNNKRGFWADNTCTGNTTSSANPTSQPTQANSTKGFSCGSKKYCNQMTTCEEAKFYLNSCGLTRLDADHDRIPCETICK